ncbi:MAG: hypothetical protein ACT4P6_11525 [Gemmatimonadaceae bacterium]
MNLGSGGWRATLGLGAILAKGMPRPNRSSSIAGSAGLDWVSPHSTGRTLTVGVRAIVLASRIAGLRYMVLPSIGVSF